MSSVLKAMTSSGMSSQVSSAGASGVVSISPSAGTGIDNDGTSSGCFSGLLGGGLGGGAAEDILNEQVVRLKTDACTN